MERKGRRGANWSMLIVVVMMSGLTSWQSTPIANNSIYGSFGPEGLRLREQLWVLPSADPSFALRATLFRPETAGNEPTPLVIINHGTDESTRESVAMPVFYWLSRWFVDRGYAVLIPQRRGHGATAGTFAEAIDNCQSPDHARAGDAAADDIAAVLNFIKMQPFIDKTRIFVAGVSTGGWASLALAARNPPELRGVINFAGGRGAYANGRSNSICGAGNLIEAAGRFGSTAKVPTLWLYSENDSYFDPDVAKSMAKSWTKGGGQAEFLALPAYGSEGHRIADDRAGWRLWGTAVEKFIHYTRLAGSEF